MSGLSSDATGRGATSTLVITHHLSSQLCPLVLVSGLEWLKARPAWPHSTMCQTTGFTGKKRLRSFLWGACVVTRHRIPGGHF